MTGMGRYGLKRPMFCVVFLMKTWRWATFVAIVDSGDRTTFLEIRSLFALESMAQKDVAGLSGHNRNATQDIEGFNLWPSMSVAYSRQRMARGALPLCRGSDWPEGHCPSHEENHFFRHFWKSERI